MWCANCQAEVAAEVLDNNRTVLCANCQSELGSLRGASPDERTRQARELLERWAQSGITDPLSPGARSRGPAGDPVDPATKNTPDQSPASAQSAPPQPPDSPAADIPAAEAETGEAAEPAAGHLSAVDSPPVDTPQDTAGRPSSESGPRSSTPAAGGRRLRFDAAEHSSEQSDQQGRTAARSAGRSRPADPAPAPRQPPRPKIRFDQPHGEPSDTPDRQPAPDRRPTRAARDEQEMDVRASSEQPPEYRDDSSSRHLETKHETHAPSEAPVRFHQPARGPHSARRTRRPAQESAYYEDTDSEADGYDEQSPPSQPPYRTPDQRAQHQTPPERAVQRVSAVRPRRPHFADVTEQRSRVHEPHAAAPQPHFDIQAFMEPAPETPSNWLSIVGPVLAYLGVGLLTVGTVLVLWAWFGGPASYAPTGWLITTAGQMLLFLGIVTLVSGGMEQTTTEVRTRIAHLGDRLLRMEHASRDHALRGPSIPSEHFDQAARPARSREQAQQAQPRRRRRQ